jgi:antirestriction protein ArdC
MAAITSPLAEHQPTEKPALRDFRQEVTDNIIGMLERGVAPWQKPWEPGAGSLGIPFNPTSERAYRGGNAIHLMATGLQRGYEDSRWMTYKQASDNGWQVRRGEKGTQIEYWEVKDASDNTRPSRPDGSRDGSAAMLRRGFDVRTVQHWMGHKSLETTMRYLAPATDVHDEVDLVTIPSVSNAESAPRKSASRETRSLRKARPVRSRAAGR